MEDWWPITSSKAKIQVEWCINKKHLNLRARRKGEACWEYGTATSLAIAEMEGIWMVEERENALSNL